MTSRADPKALPTPLPAWESWAAIGAGLLFGALLGFDKYGLIGVAIAVAVFLARYAENDRARWSALVEILADTNLAGIELQTRLLRIEEEAGRKLPRNPPPG